MCPPWCGVYVEQNVSSQTEMLAHHCLDVSLNGILQLKNHFEIRRIHIFQMSPVENAQLLIIGEYGKGLV